MARKQGLQLRPKLISIAVASCFVTTTALANPTGPTVVHGAANIQQIGNLLKITNSPSAIINWQSFSIGASEITRFIQQSQSSAVLNRVTGSAGAIDPSVILGALQSNGRVFLINPSGILFGAGAQIDVAGLVASSLNLSNADFLANRLKFTDVPGAGSVINQGNITTGSGGNVYLVGSAVTNNGIITSPQGEVVLAAGNSVELVNPGTPNLRVEVSAQDEEARNIGQIIVDAGRVGIYAGLVNQSGTIRANGASVTDDGRIVLKATKNATLEAGSVTSASGESGGSVTVQSGDTTLVSGTVEATGASGQGGTIEVLGNLVGLTGNASLDASGASGGGTVLVGGDFQGKNPDVQNAFRTYVGPDATIKADAVTSGDGGKVIVWSDDATRFYGRISAKGGAQSGDGGFAEVSGKGYLDFQGTANLSAANGAAGTLLLDPNNVTIDNTGPDSAGLFDGEEFFWDSTGPSTITWATIKNQLDISNAIITTSGGGSDAGDITVNADSPDLATDKSLSLLAHQNIWVDGSITNSGNGIGTGGLSLYAGWDGIDTVAPNVTSGTGLVTIQAPINFGGGKVMLIAGSGVQHGEIAGAITANELLAYAGSGSVLLNGTENSVGTLAGRAGTNSDTEFRFKNAGTLMIGSVDGGVGSVDGGGAIGIVDGVTVSNSGNATIDITVVSGDLIVNRNVTATAGNSNDAATVLLTSETGKIDVNAGTSVSAVGGSGEAGGSATVTLNAGTSINLNNASVSAYGGGGTSFQTTGSQSAALVTLIAGTSIDVNGSTVRAVGGDLSGSGQAGHATIQMAAPAGITVRNTSLVEAIGGDGQPDGGSANGGYALIELCAGYVDGGCGPSATGSITVSGSQILAEGGPGGGSSGSGRQGGGATINLVANSISINSGSEISATGGQGGDGSFYSGGGGQGGEARVALTGNTINVNNSSLSATGGAGGSGGPGSSESFGGGGGMGGAAQVILESGAGGVTVSSGSTLQAIGGAGGGGAFMGDGGEGFVTLYSSNGPVTISNSTIAAQGGAGNYQGYAEVKIESGFSGSTPVTITGSTISADGAEGGYYSSRGAVVDILGASVGITSSTIASSSTGGSSSDEATIELYGAAGVVVTSSALSANAYGGEANIYVSSDNAVNLSGGSLAATSVFNDASLLISTGAPGANIGITNGSLTADSVNGTSLIGLQAGGSITATNSTIAASSSNVLSAVVGLKAGSNITLSGGEISATDTGGGPSLVGLLAGNNVTLGGDITTSGQPGSGSWLQNYSDYVPQEVIDLDPDFSGIAILAGNKIIGGAGILDAVYPGQAIALKAANGIGSIGTTPVPVRIIDGSEATGAEVFVNNTTSGDIAVSFVTNGIQFVGDVDGVRNGNPNGAYFIQTEAAGGHIELGIPFLPDGLPLLAGQTVIFQANQGDVLFNTGGSVATSGGGVTTAIGQNVLVNDGTISGIFNAVATTGNVTQTGGTVSALFNANSLNGGINLAQSGNYNLGLLTAPNGTVSVTSYSGAILDGNSGLNVVAPVATLVSNGAGGIGTLANPLETRVGELALSAAYGGAIGIINDGNLVLSSLNFNGTSAAIYASTQLGASTGSLSMSGPVSVTGNLSLLSDTGMALSSDISASGVLTLDGGGGNLDITSAGGGTLINAGTVIMRGADVNLGGANQTYGLDIVGNSGLGIIAGNLNVQGGNGGYTFVRSNGGNLAISTTGNVNVTGGTSGGFAHVLGYPDVVMSVGGTVNINATDPSAPGRIESGLPTTIHLDFTTLTSGGYFVNGVENVVADPDLGTGFYADGSPAVLGQNLIVTYGGVPPQVGLPGIEQAIAQVIASTNENSIINDEDKEPETNNETTVIADGKEKKELPVCK